MKGHKWDPKTYVKLVATLPDCRDKDLADESDRDEAIWVNPPNFFDDPENVENVHDYVTQAKEVTGMGIDQALYRLMKRNYDIPAATEAVHSPAVVRPIPWSKKDRELFCRCLAAYGKDFRRIQAVMYHKHKRELVDYYYKSKPKEKFKSSVYNIGPEDVYFDDFDDDADVTKGNCQQCLKEDDLRNCNGFLVCNSCRLKEFMEDFEEEEEKYDFPDDNEPRLPNKCPAGWEGFFKNVVKEQVPISWERFEELKKEELERVTTLVKDYGEGETLEGVLRDRPSKYGFFFLNQDKSPTEGQTNLRILRNKAAGCILRSMKLEEEVDLGWSELEPELERIESERLEYNEKKKAEPKLPRIRYSAQWTDQEKDFAIAAFFRYGLDFSAIVRTKTADMCKAFYEKNKELLAGPVQKREHELTTDIPDVVVKKELKEDIEDVVAKMEKVSVKPEPL